ncbi:helix-turn-helix domain-containing protein [Lentzea sp. NPDC051838]|uniref:AraC-like ligand-binding domain-containing protein n=1 Tax=Lentzea sp. NPDC051838 TaxID=3154849 RepID=UPI003427E50A
MAPIEARGKDEWAEVISHSFVPLTLGDTADAFRGTVQQTVLLSGVTVTDVRTYGPSVVLRTNRLTRSQPREDYLFSLHLHGMGTVVQDDRVVTLQPGSGALYDTTRPYRLLFPTSTREIVLQVPRRMLRDRLDDAAGLCGRDVPAGSPATRLLAVFLQELVATSPDLDPEHRAEFGWTAIEVLATALRATTTNTVAAQPLLPVLRQFVSTHLADPDLSPAVLARAHGVSPRHVTELFAGSGTSPAAFIRTERLKAAHRALTDPRQAHRTIASIAAQFGFPDRTTFTRAFVRRYGVAPAEARTVRGTPPAGA